MTDDRILKYKKWVKNAEKAREIKVLGERENQYDKAEELITFYTFAPLEREKTPNQIKQKIVQEILNSISVNETVNAVKLYLEKELPPPDKYLKWLNDEVTRHPIRYIREQANRRKITKRRLEGDTQVDAIIETENLVILIEVKFTSDISSYTKFGLKRNQIARLIDVGVSRVQKLREKGFQKKLIVLCCTPEEPFQKRSRFYYYKIKEYSDPLNIQNDIPWRTIDEINEALRKVGWTSLEKVIEIVYQNAQRFLDSEESTNVKDFFKERMLWIST